MRLRMIKPTYSIIIPTLNEEKFLPKLLDSLTLQTVKTFEVVVVDGASVDQTLAVARRYKNKLPLTIIACEKAGVSRQRNIGAKTAKSNWLVLVDADSIFMPNFIERIDRYIRSSHAKFFTTWLKADREDLWHTIAGCFINIGVEGSVFIKKPWAPGPLTIVRRDVFESVGGYNEKVAFAEDHELGVVIFEQGVPFQILREILYVYSFRRFRKEGVMKVLNRTRKAAPVVISTHHGLTSIPGLISGGLMYNEKKSPHQRPAGEAESFNKNKFFKNFEVSMRKIVTEFVMQ